MYVKIVKYISWALLLLGVVIGCLGFVIGFTTSNAIAVDVLLGWAYAMIGFALAAIIIIGIVIGAKINPKGLIKTGIVVVAAIALVALAYLVAPGAEAVGFLGEQPAHKALKFTDTMLILTYLSCGAAILSIVAGLIIGAVRK